MGDSDKEYEQDQPIDSNIWRRNTKGNWQQSSTNSIKLGAQSKDWFGNATGDASRTGVQNEKYDPFFIVRVRHFKKGIGNSQTQEKEEWIHVAKGNTYLVSNNSTENDMDVSVWSARLKAGQQWKAQTIENAQNIGTSNFEFSVSETKRGVGKAWSDLSGGIGKWVILIVVAAIIIIIVIFSLKYRKQIGSGLGKAKAAGGRLFGWVKGGE